MNYKPIFLEEDTYPLNESKRIKTIDRNNEYYNKTLNKFKKFASKNEVIKNFSNLNKHKNILSSIINGALKVSTSGTVVPIRNLTNVKYRGLKKIKILGYDCILMTYDKDDKTQAKEALKNNEYWTLTFIYKKNDKYFHKVFN